MGLANITATSAGQAWAIGYQTFGADSSDLRPYLQRFDGQTWRPVPVSLAPSVNIDNQFVGGTLVMTSPTEGWMEIVRVKLVRPNQKIEGGFQVYILHLRNGQWQPELQVTGTTLFTALQIVSPTDGWAIANSDILNYGISLTSTLYHYDGKHWQAVGS